MRMLDGAMIENIKPVPITFFLNFIERVTGWNDFLENRDIGDLEYKLGFRVREQRLGLYRIVGDEEREDTSKYIDKLLRDM